MTDTLTGKRVAFLATDGYEDSELTSPWQAVTDAGATAVLVSPASGSIEGKNGHRQQVELASSDAVNNGVNDMARPTDKIVWVTTSSHTGVDSVSIVKLHRIASTMIVPGTSRIVVPRRS